MIELSKSDKKTAREIIKKGMMNEFEKGMNKAENILSEWKSSKSNPQDAYHKLYEHITLFDKGIVRRYDNMRTDDLIFVVIQQLREGLIMQKDLGTFSDVSKLEIQRILSL